MKLYQKRSNVVPLALFEYKTGCTVLNTLKVEKLIWCDTWERRIAIVESWCKSSIYKSGSGLIWKERPKSCYLPKSQLCGATNITDVALHIYKNVEERWQNWVVVCPRWYLDPAFIASSFSGFRLSLLSTLIVLNRTKQHKGKSNCDVIYKIKKRNMMSLLESTNNYRIIRVNIQYIREKKTGSHS